jgi:hypothetical protein
MKKKETRGERENGRWRLTGRLDKGSLTILTCIWSIYISQLIRYSRACGSYHDFLDRGLLLTRKLLNQRFLLDKLKVLCSPPRLGWPLWNICVTNDNGHVPLVVNTSQAFPHSWHHRFVTYGNKILLTFDFFLWKTAVLGQFTRVSSSQIQLLKIHYLKTFRGRRMMDGQTNLVTTG